MTRVANPFRYMYKERYRSESTIYKAWFGKKYLIWKGKALQQSVEMISKDIDNRMRLGLKENDVFENVIKHIARARVTMFVVEAVLQSDNPVELLIREHELLKAGKEDPACLNTTHFPTFPKWIPQSAVDEFQQYVAKQAAAQAPKAKKPAPAKKTAAGQVGKQARKSTKNKSNGTGKSKDHKVRPAGRSRA